MKLIASFVCASLLLVAQPTRSVTREIDNTAAFARLYGVVRFFYPSDAAADLDWDRFAVAGVARVRTATDDDALASALRQLFTPLGDGIEIAAALTPFKAAAAATEPLIAWRYLGAGATSAVGGSPYAAKRTNRARRTTAAIDGFAGVAQTFAAQGIRGQPIRLRANARATVRDASSGGALWLRVDRGTQPTGFFDNMSDRPIRDAAWHEYSIVGVVADDATNVAFGVMANGTATGDFDALELSVRDAEGTWRPLPIKDAGFEADSLNAAWSRVGSPNAAVTSVAEDAPEGRRFVRFAPPAAPEARTNELVPDAPPSIDDHVDLDLGARVKARVALALTDSQAKRAAASPLPAVAGSDDLATRLADVVVAWNFYRHFYPYFADAGVDWDARLRPQLQAAYNATTRETEADALRRLVADARDGHGRLNDTRRRTAVGMLPVQVALVESQVVVIATREPAIPVGTIVTAIDGASARDRFEALTSVQSGTTQWRQFGASQELVMCTNRPSVRLTIDDGRGPVDRVVSCEAVQRPAEMRPAQATEVSPGIWYVDLTRARSADVRPIVESLAKAKGVIVDLRGYPTDAAVELLPHLIEAPEHDRWMHVAKITGPFGQAAHWLDLGWNLQPVAPRLSGTIVFLTDGRAISYAESVMGYVGDRHLATIVGSTTAGTNGNIATFTLPGGFGIVFTGMRVTGHDGTAPHHLVGIKPDIRVTPTIAGLRAGRDEVLERALALMP